MCTAARRSSPIRAADTHESRRRRPGRASRPDATTNVAHHRLEQAVVHLPYTQSPPNGADCSPTSRTVPIPTWSRPQHGLMDITVIIVVVIVTALAFDFTNGFHDTANTVATSIATGALKPRTAVLIAGILNLVGAFLSVQVAKTISSGLVDDTKITPTVIFAGLVGAIVWNLLTWLVGLPSSSSHALIGGLIGATWVAAGADAVKFAGLFGKVLLPALLAPIIAGLVALFATYLAYRITARGAARTVTKGFKLGQVVSGSMVALAHGTNDAQKTMGIITLTLITAGALPADAGPPFWVILSSGPAIALGTYAGGWRIIQTLGMRV